MNTRILIGLVPLALLVSACGGDPEPSRVTAQQIVDKCGPSSTLDMATDGTSLEYNFDPGTESTEAIYTCILTESSAPSNVDFQIKETRPIDGTQTAEWDGWKLLWSYDGDSSRMQLSEA
ncbi:hypothetical protein CH249_14390 [Rhodococcus sp. 05-2255-3B1]|jgi:hypothetical protein|uniref:hypothetical protein n=1 Tax=unclassified Rhodococcus (in: high G+C Gram-positive bacteria) TaxID=192944 RepID=UPI000B9B81DF|nr:MULTISPECIES: hypothetical protein [unclassified Rhodococcus (in: high G+C Gram-positive bacteria)]OZE10088.1 hypothetical protein CH249_14390 [Rhodococcus sp. 05-2255-3B1]OZE10265.1 hypothetical protein CH250_13310 [Rhodococcus sp. 05-2255-3C]OZE24392.1 hypothetical protein CH255_01965 [Rhodococcus sp. 05-2255-2A2]